MPTTIKYGVCPSIKNLAFQKASKYLTTSPAFIAYIALLPPAQYHPTITIIEMINRYLQPMQGPQKLTSTPPGYMQRGELWFVDANVHPQERRKNYTEI
jgi:hypothetical protein